MSIAGKRVLILGGVVSNLILVQTAKDMGLYVIVTDNSPEAGPAKKIAHETADVSTTDIDGLVQLCKERNVDAIFTGASEFNIRNCIRVCEKNGMRFYTDMKTWDNCANKATFKGFCRKYGIDTPEVFDISEDSTDEEIAKLPYPVIVKPVDSSSSNGITVCYEPAQIREACRFARSMSGTERIIVEKFIENNRLLTSFSYLAKDGKIKCVFSCDDYQITQSPSPFHHINAAPSKHLDYYMENVHEKAVKMFTEMGIRNGSFFVQTLPYEGKIYFMEMGYRIGGSGTMGKIIYPAMGFSATECLFNYIMGGDICSDEFLDNADPQHMKCEGGAFVIVPTIGTIGKYEGLEEASKIPGVVYVLKNYQEGDTIPKRAEGTLGQYALNFVVLADSMEQYLQIAEQVQNTVKILDTEGNLMSTMPIDFDRLRNK